MNHKKNENQTRPVGADLGLNLESMGGTQEKDLHHALHQLREHQIELETVNEELRFSQQEAMDSQIKYKELYDLAPVGYCSVDSENVIIEGNHTLAELLGVAWGKLVGQRFTHFILPEDQDVFYLHCRAVADQVEPLHCELRMRHPEYHLFWANLQSTPLKDNKRQITLSDVTLRRQLEANVLEQGKARYLSILRTTMNGFWLVDMQGRLQEVNDAYCRMSGYSMQELLTMTVADLEAIETKEETLSHLRRVCEHGEHRFESQHRRKDGSIFFVEVNAQYLAGDGGLLVAFLHDITERKLTEENLRKSENRLRMITDHIPAYIAYVGTADLRYQFVNVKFEEGFKRPREEIVGMHIKDLIGESNYEFALKYIAEVKKGHSISYENAFNLKQGKSWISVNYVPDFNDNGEVVGIFVLSYDISERKQAEEQQKAHIRFLENLARVDHAIKQDMDLEKMLLSIIETVFSIFDCDRVWLLDPCDPDAPSFRVPMEISRPEYPGAQKLNQEVPVSLEQAQSMREALAFPGPVVKILGTEKPVAKETFEQFGVQSEIFAAIYPRGVKPWLFGMHQCSYPRIWTTEEQTLFNEISRRISDELNNLLSLRKLRESEARFRALFEQAAVGVSQVETSTGRLVAVNQRYCNILGYDPHELTGQTFMQISHPDDLEEDLKNMARLTSGQISEFSMEKRLIKKDGSPVWVNLTVSPMWLAGEEPDFHTAIVEDITQRKHIEAEKSVLLSQLHQAKKMQAVGTLAGGIAHEFNNLLSVILGCTEMAKDDDSNSTKVRTLLGNVLTASYRARDLVKQILTFSRQAHQKRLSVNLFFTVKDALKLIQTSIPSSVETMASIDPRCGNSHVDPTEIQQIIMNLVSNAVWAMKEKGTLRIALNPIQLTPREASVLGLSMGNWILLSVSDDGIGMDKETLSRIFDPFFTRKVVGKGTGMGLSIVYSIMESYGGCIKVESEPGAGSTFNLYFPVTNELPVFEKESVEAVPKGQERILLVDDDENYAKMMADMIGILGYDVVLKTKSLEALSLFKSAPDSFDLVISDQVMPGLSGEELIREIRSVRAEMPVILCTGFSSQMDAEKATVHGINEFAFKPISKREIAAMIRRVLDAS